jgi:hypothetical protein
MSGVRFPVWEIFSLLHIIQTGSEDNLVSYTMEIWGDFSESKRPQPKPNMMGAYLHSSIYLHDTVFN